MRATPAGTAPQGEGRSPTVDEEARRQVARRSRLWSWFFAQIFGRELRRSFHAVRIARSGPRPRAGEPRLIVYANHPSWWDAAIFSVLTDRLFDGRASYAPIDAAMLEKYGFMARIGAFGVAQQGGRGAAMFLAAATQVLAEDGNLLFISAQGRFADVRERPIGLAPGLAHLIDRRPDATIVPLALDYPFWNERKPELLMRFGPSFAARSLLALKRPARQAELAGRLEDTMTALTTEALTRDPALFETLIDGAAGVGGVYDLWRRARAAARGQRFEAQHGGGAR